MLAHSSVWAAGHESHTAVVVVVPLRSVAILGSRCQEFENYVAKAAEARAQCCDIQK